MRLRNLVFSYAALRHPGKGEASQEEAGAATVEFVFLGILVLVPLLYLVLTVFELQRNAFGVTQAAREAGRAFATADDVASGVRRAQYAMRVALRDQGLDAEDAVLRFVSTRASCQSGSPAPEPGAATLIPGTDFSACVVRTFRLPGVPAYVAGGRNSVTGRFVVHIDNYRAAGEAQPHGDNGDSTPRRTGAD